MADLDMRGLEARLKADPTDVNEPSDEVGFRVALSDAQD